jgi:hypothetical protein
MIRKMKLRPRTHLAAHDERMTPLRPAAAAALLLAAALARASGAGEDSPAPDHGKVATEDATPAGAGTLEVEAAYSPTFTHRGSGSFERSARGHSHALTLAALYGVADDLDVKISGGFGYLVDRTDLAGPTRGSGGSDLAFGTKLRLLANPARALDLAMVTTFVAPTGAEEASDRLGLTQGYWSMRNALVASKDWGRTTANAELALTVPVSRGAGDLVGGVSANAALGHAFVSWLQPLLEVNYDGIRDQHDHQRLALTAGVNVSARSGKRLLLGVQRAVWGRYVAQDTTALVAAKAAF